MTTENRPTRLELAPPYLEVWEQDGGDPELYHFEGETLSTDALNRRADASPGLTVVRVSWQPPARASA